MGRRSPPLTTPEHSAAIVGLKAQFDAFFESHDLLLSPTMAVPAFEIEQHPTTIGGQEVDPFFGYLPFTYPINAIGPYCGERTVRLFVGRHAHWLAYCGTHGRRGDGARSVGGIRASDALGGPKTTGVLTISSS